VILVPVGFPFIPIEATEPVVLGALAHTPQRCTSLVAVAHGSSGHQPGDFLAVSRNRDLFALLDRSSNWPSLFFASKAPISRMSNPILASSS
jgi:hypothetical protein